MVFESLVADLLNKYLGDYVENLDKSQLNIGIWGGDVVLKNLDLKASALDDLNLPVKVIAGHLGTLILKIPWKKIYTEPLEVVIEDLFAIAGPNAGQKYDEEKEEKALVEKKQKQLNRVESLKLAEEASAKETGKKGDSFAEKLATQVVKNLQVKVKNIHIRYEDFYTTPDRPYAVGITLDNLSFQTVDETGAPKVIKETVQKIFKSVKLNNLALYWNSDTSTYMKGAKESIYATLREKVATDEKRVKEHQWLIRPINCSVSMELDTHPEKSGFSAPKLVLSLVLQEIALQLSRTQYHDIMEMLESFERMVLADKFRKYRRYLPAQPSRKQMWKYAYTCILEENVKRKRKMWSWVHMKRHSELKKIYKEAYRKKLESSKKQTEVYRVIEQCERELDVFSIVLMRSQAEMAFARAQKEKSKGGIFSFLKGKKAKPDKGLTDQISGLMTDDEYSKLYKAIGYEESNEDANALPPEYVAHKLHFELHSLSLTLQDEIEKKNRKVLCMEVSNVFADIMQKPTSGNLNVKARMSRFGIHGLVHDSVKPMIVRSLAQEGSDLLDLEFELQPMDKSCDQRINVTARATEIVYDAMTINQVVSFFKPPEHVKLKQLSKAAVSRYRKLKEQSTSGLKDIVQHHKYTEVKASVEASYILIPEFGTYKPGDTNLIVIDLGHLNVNSEKDPQAPKKYRAKAAMLKARKLVEDESQDEMLDLVMEKAYDSFTFELDQFQVLYASKGSDWRALRTRKSSPMHIIQPMGYKVLLQKCMIVDPRLANVKVSGTLPQVQLTLSDVRMLDMIRLLLSISLPETVLSADDDDDDDDSDYASLNEFEDTKDVILEERDEFLSADEDIKVKGKTKVIENATNMTEVDMSFEIEEIEVKISRTVLGKEEPFLKLKLDSIGAQVKVRSFDIVVDSYLGGIYLQHLMFKVPDKMLEWIANQSPTKHKQAVENGHVINLINTPVDNSQSDRLLTISFLMAHNDNPEFSTTYKNTENKLEVVFSHLEVLLHEQALVTIMSFAQNLGSEVTAMTPQEAPPTEGIQRKRTSSVSDVVEFLGKQATKSAVKLLEPKVIHAEIIRFDMSAHMNTFECSVCTEHSLITNMNIRGFDAGVVIQDSQTEIKARLTNIEVMDPEPTTMYPKVMSIDGSEVFKMTTTLYNQATKGSRRYADMTKVDTRVVLDVSSIRFVFLYRYISQIIDFVDNFDIAKKQALEISAKAGEMALDVAQSMHSKATRLALAITVNAPIITIPTNSTSDTALVVHLGTVSVHNSFGLSQDKAKNADGVPAVLDYMNVSLTHLQVQRALMDKKNSTSTLAVCRMLQPVDMNVIISRNLASSWYHKAPIADIQCTLPTVKVACSQGDLTVLIKILHENIGEGVHPSDSDVVPVTAKAHTSTSSAVAQTAPMMSMTPAKDLYTDISVTFSMDILEAVLYNGESRLSETVHTSSGENVVSHTPSQALARFSVTTLAGNFLRKSDNSMEAGVSIYDCNLDDIRPEYSQGITKMLERVDTSSAEPMVKLVFTQYSDLRKTVDVHLNKLFVIVAVPYLMAVANLFIEAIPKVENKHKAAVKGHKDVISGDVTNETLSAAETTITLHVQHPEIILVEDTMAKNTNALIIDTGVNFEMRLSSLAIKLKAGLELQIISAMYNVTAKEYRKKAQIMKPCSVHVYGSAPENSGMHIDLSLTTLDVCVSPATIMTVSRIVSNLQLPKASDAENSDVVAINNLWIIEKVAEMKLWYLNTDPTDDFPLLDPKEKAEERGEQMIVSAPHIIFKLEGGTGNKTVPLLVAELDVHAEVKDWSSKLFMESTLRVAVSYFNEKFSVWEPFLEPVDDGKRAQPWNLAVEHKPVCLVLKLKQNDEYYNEYEEDESESEVIDLQPPKMSLTVLSEDSMQLCLSKAGLDMLSALWKSFDDAYQLVQPSTKAGASQAPYSIRNDTGTLVSVTIDSQLEVIDSSINVIDRALTLEPNVLVPLQQRAGIQKSGSLLKQAQEGKELDFTINMLEYEASRDVVIQKAIKRCFHLFRHQDPHALVVETTADLGRRLITLRSDTEIANTLDMKVSVLYMNMNDELTLLTTVTPGDRYNIPLPVVYGKHPALFFKPHVEGAEVSGQAVKWKTLAKGDGSQLISCPLTGQNHTFNIMVQTTLEHVYTEATEEMKSKCNVITIKPPIVFFNQLPYAMKIKLENQQQVISLGYGKTIALHTCSASHQLGKLTVCDYLGGDWVFDGVIDEPAEEFRCCSFVKEGSSSKSLKLALLCTHDGQSRGLTLYSPYWFVNRTGLDLFYKDSSSKDQEILPHEATYGKPYLFCFSKLVSSEKACMKINDSKWSDKFSLDTVGSTGTTTCKSESLDYKVAVKITLSSNAITKIIECSPYYVLVNRSNASVTFTEEVTGGASLTVTPEECLPFWPCSSKNKKMKIGLLDTSGAPASSGSFYFDQIHSTLLKISHELAVNQKCAMHVEVTKSDLATVITVEDYRKGMETARIVNCMSDTLVTYHQQKSTQVSCLGPGESCLYTWENPLDKRILMWSSGQEADKQDELIKDGIGEFFADKDSNHKLFWVSFLDGMQRVLLFTEDFLQASRAQEAGDFERIDMEIVLSLEGAGLSVVNNDKRQEIAYLGVTSSGAVWEEKRKRRWRAFNHQICDQLEEAWIKYQNIVATGKPTNSIFTADKLEVDLQSMRQLKPNGRQVRRTFQPGVWVQFKTSLHQTHLHAKINRIQLDNQLPGAVYPVVFSPTPLPKSITAESVPKPFIEASLVMRKHEHSEVQQIKYMKVLVQEMTVKADQGFINALIPFFGEGKRSPEQLSKDFETDLENLSISLLELSAGSANKGHKNFYDMLHFSPLKIHLSFSVTGEKADGKAAFQSEVVRLFLQSVGVVLTDVQDVVFRIAYFERNFVFFEQTALVKQIQRHYTQQAIQQAYVLVLGLDVLGNPFGLIEGLADGAKGLFYEPVQGAIQGPEEFAEGLALGLRSLLSGTLGGAAGAASRITGTLGKGLAALTLDDKYQQRRREKMNKQPANLQEGLARGVKGLGMGFFDGVTGIVRKPVEGAKQEGVEGFFKGIGKGLIGVVARPTGGIVDFASSSFEGIRKATTLSQEVRRLRPPRVIRRDGVITPYNYRNAAGHAMLQELDHGRYTVTDQFIAHCLVTIDGNNFLLATDKRVFFIKRGEILGHWDVEWSYLWTSLIEKPSIVEGSKIRLMSQPEEKKKFSLFGAKNTSGKLIAMPDLREAEWMVREMVEAYSKAR